MGASAALRWESREGSVRLRGGNVDKLPSQPSCRLGSVVSEAGETFGIVPGT